MGVNMEIYNGNQEAASKTIKAINITLIVVIAILAFVLISMTFLWTPMTVNGPSMNNTLHDGEHIILLTAWYSYNYGDIIVFKKDDEKNIIKRVIGLPGDHIRFDVDELAYYRNGEKLVEDYVSCEYTKYYIEDPNIKADVKKGLCSSEGYLVEEGKLFVLGDNRTNSNDSHRYGSIDETQLIGKYLFGY